jgi:hypothetical protein
MSTVDALAFEELRARWRSGRALENAPALDAYLRSRVPQKLPLKLNLVIGEGPPPPSCSFCGKSSDEAGRLIGADHHHARICGRCAQAAVALCAG